MRNKVLAVSTTPVGALVTKGRCPDVVATLDVWVERVLEGPVGHGRAPVGRGPGDEDLAIEGAVVGKPGHGVVRVGTVLLPEVVVAARCEAASLVLRNLGGNRIKFILTARKNASCCRRLALSL